MRKLRLDLNEIAVETFAVTAFGGGAAGTVEGQQLATQQWGSVCAETPACHESAEYACPTASCAVDCTAQCTGSGPTYEHTCPATCDWGGGCFSGHPNCPA